MRYMRILIISFAILLSSCGVFKKGTSQRISNKVKETTEVVKEVDTVDTTDTETKLEYSKVRETTNDSENSLVVKGGTELTEGVELKQGINVIKTESGGTLYAVKDETDKVSFIINQPTKVYKEKDRYTEFKEEGLDVEEVKREVREDNSKESKISKKDISEKESEKKSAPAFSFLLIAGILITILIMTKRK